MTVYSMDHLALVHEPEVLVVSMRAYNKVMGFPWFETCKPEIDRATRRLTSLRTPIGQEESCRSGMIMQWDEREDDESTNVRLPGIGGSTLSETRFRRSLLIEMENQWGAVRIVLLKK